MANETIHDQDLVSSAAADDEIALWVAASNILKRITKANFIGATLSGLGAIVTGGHTLTVPATGTAALRGVAQTFSALQTFSAGISFGDNTLAAYKVGTWTPTITAGTTNPTITYGSQDGAYIRIGGVVYYDAVITITAITVAGAGEWRFSLPLAVGRTMLGVAMFTGTPPDGGVDVPNDTVSLYFRAVVGGSYGVIRPVRDNAPVSVLGDSAFAAGDTIGYTGFYFL